MSSDSISKSIKSLKSKKFAKPIKSADKSKENETDKFMKKAAGLLSFTTSAPPGIALRFLNTHTKGMSPILAKHTAREILKLNKNLRDVTGDSLIFPQKINTTTNKDRKEEANGTSPPIFSATFRCTRCGFRNCMSEMAGATKVGGTKGGGLVVMCFNSNCERYQMTTDYDLVNPREVAQ